MSEPTQSETPESAADDPKLSIGQRLSAAIASKATLQQAITDRDKTIAEDKAQIGRLTQANTDLQTRLDQANAKITQLEADAAEVDKALKQAESEAVEEKKKNTTVDKKAQEKVASLGFPAAKLPAAQDEAGQESASDLFAKAEKTADPKERYRLVKQARDLQAREAAGDN